MNAHSHYKKDIRNLDMLDVYRVLSLFNVTDPCIQHAVKKLLVTGGRGGAKDFDKDIQDAIDSLTRLKDMRREDCEKGLKDSGLMPSIPTTFIQLHGCTEPHQLDIKANANVRGFIGDLEQHEEPGQ